MRLFRRYENGKYNERKKDAKSDPVKYFNSLGRVRDKPEDSADSTDNKQ